MALQHQLLFHVTSWLKDFLWRLIVGDGAGVGKGGTVAGEASVCYAMIIILSNILLCETFLNILIIL